MTFFSQIILIGEQGYQHQANRHLEMGEWREKGEELPTAKGKGRRKRFGGRGTRKTFISCWPGLDWLRPSLPTTLTLEASTARERIGICLIPGGNFKLPSV